MGTTKEFWRQCRAVSIRVRLRLLWMLFEERELSVMELAAGAGISHAYASGQMKILFLAGMVRFRREDMRVIYRAEADSLNVYSEKLLAALKQCFEQNVLFYSVIREVTAFTHGRRIEIVQLLMDGPVSFNELMERSGMTSSALSRSLIKLDDRRVVRGDGERYRLARPQKPLGKALLHIVCAKEEK